MILQDIFIYIIDNKPDLKGNQVCSIVAQSYGCPGDLEDWSINIPEGDKAQRPPVSTRCIRLLFKQAFKLTLHFKDKTKTKTDLKI